MRFRFGTLLRLVITLGLTAWMVHKAHPSAVGAALARASWPWVVAACLSVLLDRVLMAYRWIALLAPIKATRPGFATLLRIFLVSTFVGTFLPGSVGGDAARTWSLTREGVPMAESLASVLMDRLLGVVSILISALVGLAIVPDMARTQYVVPLTVVTGLLCMAALGFAFSTTVDDFVKARLRLLPAGKVREKVASILDALQAYRAHHGVALWVLVASLAVQALRILQGWMFGRSLGMAPPLSAYFAFIPIIVLLMQFPVSISGIGIAQWAFPVCFTRVGASEADAVALSVLFVALGIVGSLPGGLYYLSGPRRDDPGLDRERGSMAQSPR